MCHFGLLSAEVSEGPGGSAKAFSFPLELPECILVESLVQEESYHRTNCEEYGLGVVSWKGLGRSHLFKVQSPLFPPGRASLC